MTKYTPNGRGRSYVTHTKILGNVILSIFEWVKLGMSNLVWRLLILTSIQAHAWYVIPVGLCSESRGGDLFKFLEITDNSLS